MFPGISIMAVDFMFRFCEYAQYFTLNYPSQLLSLSLSIVILISPLLLPSSTSTLELSLPPLSSSLVFLIMRIMCSFMVADGIVYITGISKCKFFE